MRYLGIDFGDSRIGLAISDEFGWTAQGIDTIKNDNIDNVIKKIDDLVKEYKTEKIVIGFPKNMNGSIGVRGEKTLKFIEILKEKIATVEIITWDERLTTVMANKVMTEMKIKKNKKKTLVDKISAIFILQNYLDSIKK